MQVDTGFLGFLQNDLSDLLKGCDYFQDLEKCKNLFNLSIEAF